MNNVFDITERLQRRPARQDSVPASAVSPIKQVVFAFVAIALIGCIGMKAFERPVYEPSLYYLVESKVGLVDTGPFATEADCRRFADPAYAQCRTGVELGTANSK